MSELSSKFTREDIETLLEAMNDWELLGNQEYHVLQMIESAPMPPEGHEAFEVMAQIKEHFRGRKKHILAGRVTRQEKAIFLKAKLMLVRRDLDIGQLFDMSSNVDVNSSPVAETAGEDMEELVSHKIPVVSESADLAKRLELAEYYIKDLGDKVWEFYQQFLADRQAQ